MNTYELLKGKTAIVVGGSGDIGSAIVSGLIQSGISKVCIIDRTEPPFGIDNDPVEFVQADLSSIQELGLTFSNCLALLNQKLDVFINCAGIQIRTRSDEFSTEDWNSVLAVNLSSAFELMKLASKTMIPFGKGKIINVTSIMGVFGGKNIPAYSASKAGLTQLTKSFCNDVAEFGLNVNAVSPGYIKTKLNSSLLEDSIRTAEISSRIPQNRWGTPEDLVGATIFLASHLSDYVNGSTITVDGGYSGR